MSAQLKTLVRNLWGRIFGWFGDPFTIIKDMYMIAALLTIPYFTSITTYLSNQFGVTTNELVVSLFIWVLAIVVIISPWWQVGIQPRLSYLVKLEDDNEWRANSLLFMQLIIRVIAVVVGIMHFTLVLTIVNRPFAYQILETVYDSKLFSLLMIAYMVQPVTMAYFRDEWYLETAFESLMMKYDLAIEFIWNGTKMAITIVLLVVLLVAFIPSQEAVQSVSSEATPTVASPIPMTLETVQPDTSPTLNATTTLVSTPTFTINPTDVSTPILDKILQGMDLEYRARTNGWAERSEGVEFRTDNGNQLYLLKNANGFLAFVYAGPFMVGVIPEGMYYRGLTLPEHLNTEELVKEFQTLKSAGVIIVMPQFANMTPEDLTWLSVTYDYGRAQLPDWATTDTVTSEDPILNEYTGLRLETIVCTDWTNQQYVVQGSFTPLCPFRSRSVMLVYPKSNVGGISPDYFDKLVHFAMSIAPSKFAFANGESPKVERYWFGDGLIGDWQPISSVNDQITATSTPTP